MAITAPALLALARTLEGEDIETLKQHRPFRVLVLRNNGGLELIPGSTHKPRPESVSKIEAILDIYSATGSLSTSDYQHVSRNSSYILTLIKRLVE